MTSTNRYNSNQSPPLPLHAANQSLLNYKGKLKAVRTQAITLGPTSTITIARIKIPSPDKTSSHLIKRFDTNAISASSFFKCAFPLASDEEEETQMKYLHQIYDTHSAGALALGPDHKLTGVWVPVEHATELAEVYGLTPFASPLIAFPDPDLKSAVITSPTLTKKGAEEQNEPPNQPTPKVRSSTQNKVAVERTPTSVRSTKRTKVGPPSFGNTSPSNFNLTGRAKSPLESKKINTRNLTGGGTADSAPTSAETNQTASSASANTVDDRSQQNKTISEMDDNPPAEKNDQRTGNHGEKAHQQSQKLIGTDEQVLQAKEDACKLVSSLKSSSSSFTPQEKHQPDSKTDDVGQAATNNNERTLVSRKRSLDEVLEEEQTDQPDGEDSSPSFIRSSFLRKPFWGRSNQQSNQLKKRVFRSKDDTHSSQSSIDNTNQGLNLIDSNKRNIAIAGIVLAGAAASIVPYFF